MAVTRYKVLVVEIDGVDLDYQEERPLDAANVFFDNPDYDNMQDGLANVGDLVEVLVVPIPLVYNGNIGNGTFIGYNNLISGDSTPIVSPIVGDFTGFTFSNSNDSADFELVFRRGSTTATPFFNWSVDNTRTASVELPSPEPFTAGEAIYIEYLDQGQNAQDAAIVLKFKA